MNHFTGYALIAFIAFVAGALYDSNRMANDTDYHDYWMRKCKKS